MSDLHALGECNGGLGDERDGGGAALGTQIRETVALVRTEGEVVLSLLDDLTKLADSLDTPEGSSGESTSAAGDLLAVVAVHAPHELRAVSISLRKLRTALDGGHADPDGCHTVVYPD